MKLKIPVILLWIFLLGACQRDPEVLETPAPTVEPTPVLELTATPIQTMDGEEPEKLSSTAAVVISELLTGVPDGNNREFIELYNQSIEHVDLAGWSLWYVTREGQEATKVFQWVEREEIPAKGHYLLVREGESFDVIPDAVYDVAIFESKGGLQLVNPAGDVVERVGWGEAPADYFASDPIVDFQKGNSLERLPGGILGNGRNSGNNAADFVARSNPNPQNSGSSTTPLPMERLEISLEYPDRIPPGENFELTVQVENNSESPAADVLVSLPIDDQFEPVALPIGSQIEDGRISFSFSEIDPGEIAKAYLTLAAPYANMNSLLKGYYAETSALPRAYGELQLMQMDGSAIPIAVARSLPEGSVVTVEGVVTMYPGGFFAGSSSAKFYLEDETGGVQVFADGGRFDVDVNLGDQVRVTGQTELFRDSLEVIPLDNAADIFVIDNSGPLPDPTQISVSANERDDAVLGRLNVIEGTIERIEEFRFHYEIDLVDEEGNGTLLYAEKDTGISADPLNIGSRYRVTGISEYASGVRQLKPRLQSDFEEVFPPVLLLELDGPVNANPGETVTMTVTAVNHTDTTLTNINITVQSASGEEFEWSIPQVDGQGGSGSVDVTFEIPEDAAGTVEYGTISAIADQWEEAAVAPPFVTYIGQGVPIWAIQGEGSRSPFVGEKVTAIGAVTGVFPDMDGFFMQTLDPDGNSATSDGIFVDMANLGDRVELGQIVAVNGRVREEEGQTILRPAVPADIMVQDEELEEEITPVRYDPPADDIEAETYKESLEGMLVTIDEPATVIGPTNRYGEYILVYDKWGKDQVRRTDLPVGYMMWVDDGTFNTHEDQTTLPVAVARGDTVNEISGPLAYTFGNHKIAPLSVPDIEQFERNLPSLLEARENQFSVVSFNVENLFDTDVPHPGDLPRLSEEEFQNRLNKIAEAIITMGAPTVLAVQEIENIGVLEALAANDKLADYDYIPISLESKDSRGIDMGYLVRGDRVTVEDFAVFDAPNDLFSRPPLMLKVTIHLDSGDRQVIFLNNHFLSLSAGEAQTEPVRNDQAAWNVSLLEELKTANPEAQFIIIGDLNSFYDTLPIHTLQDGGLRHAYEFVDGQELPYTYIFEGATQSLDHILMSDDLFENLSSVEAIHINADYPIAHPDDASPRRISDHDPLWVLFTFE